MRRWLPMLAALVALTAAPPALAQDAAEDWDLTVDPAQQLTLAGLNFGDNALALRCRAGALDLLLTGMPGATQAWRVMEVRAGGIAGERQVWETQPGLTVLAAPEPDRLARQLRAGGDLELRLEPVAEGERGMRYRLPTPPSAASIDRVLTACGESLTDDWDALPRVFTEGIAWGRQVRPEYPERALRVTDGPGAVRIGCIVPADGRFRECRVLAEAPANAGFGESALRAALQSTVVLPENDASAVGKVVQFLARFRAPGSEP